VLWQLNKTLHWTDFWHLNKTPHWTVLGIGALSLEVKWPGRKTNHSPPSSSQVKECVDLYLHSPNTPSWRGAQLKNKHGDNFTFLPLPPPPPHTTQITGGWLAKTSKTCSRKTPGSKLSRVTYYPEILCAFPLSLQRNSSILRRTSPSKSLNIRHS